MFVRMGWVMRISNWRQRQRNKFLICQITAEEIISLPDNSTQSGSSVKQTNDVKNENCNKLLVGPIITRPPTLLESYIWNTIRNIFQNISWKPFSDLTSSPYWSRTFWIYDAPAFPCPLLRWRNILPPALTSIAPPPPPPASPASPG